MDSDGPLNSQVKQHLYHVLYAVVTYIYRLDVAVTHLLK